MKQELKTQLSIFALSRAGVLCLLGLIGPLGNLSAPGLSPQTSAGAHLIPGALSCVAHVLGGRPSIVTVTSRISLAQSSPVGSAWHKLPSGAWGRARRAWRAAPEEEHVCRRGAEQSRALGPRRAAPLSFPAALGLSAVGLLAADKPEPGGGAEGQGFPVNSSHAPIPRGDQPQLSLASLHPGSDPHSRPSPLPPHHPAFWGLVKIS